VRARKDQKHANKLRSSSSSHTRERKRVSRAAYFIHFLTEIFLFIFFFEDANQCGDGGKNDASERVGDDQSFNIK
jgi:hypothetical protein